MSHHVRRGFLIYPLSPFLLSVVTGLKTWTGWKPSSRSLGYAHKGCSSNSDIISNRSNNDGGVWIVRYYDMGPTYHCLGSIFEARESRTPVFTSLIYTRRSFGGNHFGCLQVVSEDSYEIPTCL